MDFTVPISFTTETFPPAFPEFQNHYQSVAFLTTISGRDPPSSSPWGPPVNTTLDVNIYTQYCRPNGVKGVQSPSNVQVLSHGLGFDHHYWDFGGPDSEYNYVKSATEAGYATLSYDRIGTGKSTVLDPYTEVQLGVEVTVAATLTKLLREGKLSSVAGCQIPTPKKVVHIGHSFGKIVLCIISSDAFANYTQKFLGSLITGNLVGSAPELSDGIVLTAYSTNAAFTLNFAVATNFHLASEADPERFADRSTGYLTWPDELPYQLAFFHYPEFDPAVLAATEATRYPFAIGEILQPYDVKFPAWKGPLLVSRDRL